jgi:hypothetical protein
MDASAGRDVWSITGFSSSDLVVERRLPAAGFVAALD